jgi:RimJ/RimL family protein N-acetyltransferase
VGEPRTSLRPATPADADRVLEWRNDPAIWSLGSTARPVEPAEHARWFEQTLASPDHLLFIIEIDGEPGGQLRLDRIDASAAAISVYLTPSLQGRGAGTAAIRAGATNVLAEWGLERVVACVRDDNPRGRQAFLKVGFAPEPAAAWCGEDHVELSLRPDDSA